MSLRVIFSSGAGFPPRRETRRARPPAPAAGRAGTGTSFLPGAVPKGNRRAAIPDRTAPADAYRVSSWQRQPGVGPLQEKLKFLLKPLLCLALFLALTLALYHLGLFHFFMNQERLQPLTLLRSPLTEKFVAAETMERFDYLLHHKGAFLVFLLFLIPGFTKDYLCYILGLGHLTTLEFLSIATTGRLLGTMLLTLGGTFLRNHQYYRFFLLSGAAAVIVFLTIAYRGRLEQFFQRLHERHLRKKGK